jgi:hypothetical protein
LIIAYWPDLQSVKPELFWVQKDVDDLVMKHTGRMSLELHGSHLKTGNGEWRGIPLKVREDLMTAALEYIASNYPNQFILFGAVINKKLHYGNGTAISKDLFTQITSRFDMFLKRRHHDRNEQARGIAIFDKSTSEHQYQIWSQIFQTTGNHWGNTLVNFSEVPLFLDSKMSRLIQVADIIAYSLFRKYEHNDNSFSIIQNCFDTDKSGAVHGLWVR